MRKGTCRMTALLLTAALCVSLCTDFAVNAQEPDTGVKLQQDAQSKTKERRMSAGASASSLRAPRIAADSSMTAGQKVTWDCVWFGSYPQSEVTGSDAVYSTLQNAGGWDVNNDITVNGNRYRRMKKEDATYATSGSSSYYNWTDSTTYHYFKYEPIKWRVLKTDGGQALLLSDVALDDQIYNTVLEAVTWEKSTIRSWMNGYGATSNQRGIDYSGKNFIGSAFTSSGRSAIQDTSVVNADNIEYGTEGGNDTTDQVFLLSEAEVYGDSAVSHGFVSNRETYDEARRCKSSTYAKAMGVYSNTSDAYKGNCSWWLRSPGMDASHAVRVGDDGNGFRNYNGYPVLLGVRPALNLNLSSNQWSYAGTVSSDGTVNEEGGGEKNPGGNDGSVNQTIIERVSEYTSDELYAQFNAVMDSDYSNERKWKMWLNLFISYGITDVQEGIRYLSKTTDKRLAYLYLTNSEIYCANNFQYMLDHTAKGHLMRAGLIADGLIFNNEINDWLDFTTLMDTEYPGVAKYKAMLYDFMEASSESIEIQSNIKLLSELSKKVTGVAKLKADNLIEKLNACRNIKEEKEILKSNAALEVWAELSEKRDKDGNIVLSYQLDQSSGFGQFEKAMGYAAKTLSIVDMTVTDVLDFLTLDSKLAVYAQYKTFLKDIVLNTEYIPFQMRWAASIIMMELDEGYWGKIKDVVVDIMEQTDINNTIKNVALEKLGASSFASWLAVINIEAFFINQIADVGGMVKNEAYVEGYSYLAHAFKTQLEQARKTFIDNKTEENAWNFYYNYNILYKLRYKGEEAYLAMTKVNGIAGLFSDYGYAARAEVVTDTLSALREKCQFTFDHAKAVPESCQYAMKSVTKCPVNVEVYAPDGKLAATLKDGKESDITNEYGRFIVVYDSYSGDYTKVVCLNTKGNYRLKLTGTDDGLVSMELAQADEQSQVIYAIDNTPVNENTVIDADIVQMTQEKTYNIDQDGDGTLDRTGVVLSKDSSYIAAENVSLNHDKMELKAGESRVLQVEFSPANASDQSVSWQSVDPKIAVVTGGKVKAVSAGTTTIICVSIDNPDMMASCEVTVIPGREDQDNDVEHKVKVSSIRLSGFSKRIAAGKKLKLTAAVFPSCASNKKVTWKSGSPKIATVDNTGLVTMKKGSGGKKVKITAMATDGSGIKESYTITSMKGVVKKIALSGISKKIAAGRKIKLAAKVTASKNANRMLRWKSGNPKVAVVTSKGVVTMKKNSGGKTVTITASATDGSGKKASCKLTSMKGVVKKVIISGKKTKVVKAGKSLQLKARVTASNAKKANRKLKWTSGNKKYAVVSSTGKVRTKKAGKGKKVKITAMAADGSRRKTTVTIKIR